MATVDDVIKAYIQVRDQLDALKKEQAAQLKPLTSRLATLEGWLHGRLIADGLQNYKGKAGTAFRKTHTSVKVVDWDIAREFVVDNQAWEFLEARMNKTAVDEYVKETGSAPPGVEITRAEVVQVRR